MSVQQTGVAQDPNWSSNLSNQLQSTMARYDLDTVEMEELIAWGSTAMESHSPNSSQGIKMLMAGLKSLSAIMSDDEVFKAGWVAILQSRRDVRFAAVIDRPGKPQKIVVYLR